MAAFVAETTVGANGLTTSLVPANTAGNLLVLCIACRPGTSTHTVADTGGNTWTQATVNGATEIWYSLTTSVAGTVTVTGTVVASATLLSCLEFSGIDAAPLDVANGDSATNNAPATGTSAATTQADEVVVGFIQQNSGSAVFSAQTAGYTVRPMRSFSGSSYQVRAQSAYQILAATGTQAYGASSTASTTWIAILATFKAASGGPTPISDSDSLAITEAVMPALGGSDSLAVTENSQVNLGSSDSVNFTESFSLGLSSGDSTAITESSLIRLNASDSLSVAEGSGVSRTASLIGSADSLTISDRAWVYDSANLIPAADASFEMGSTAWSGAVFSSAASFDGTYSVFLSGHSSLNISGISAGHTYTASARVLAFGAGAVACHWLVNWYTAGDAYIGYSLGSNFTSNTVTWVEVTASLTAPVGAVQAVLIIYVGGTFDYGYVDKLSFLDAPPIPVITGADSLVVTETSSIGAALLRTDSLAITESALVAYRYFGTDSLAITESASILFKSDLIALLYSDVKASARLSSDIWPTDASLQSEVIPSARLTSL